MKRFVTGASLFVLTASAALAQAPARPQFEVASIKPAQQSNDGRIMVRMGSDPGRIDYTNVSLMELIRRAYDVKDYQISGPDWLAQQRFDVKATHEPNAPREQVNLMLQALLEDRFKIVIRKEKRSLPAYALTAAKGGFKLKPLTEEELNAEPALPPGARPMAIAPGGRGPGGPGGGGLIMMRMSGATRGIRADRITIPALADMLASQTGRPVVDTTGIKGTYKVEIEYTPDETTPGPRMMMAGGPPPPPPPGAVPEGRPEAPSLMQVLQDTLGLKLDARKEPLDFLVIDKIEKLPTEN